MSTPPPRHGRSLALVVVTLALALGATLAQAGSLLVGSGAAGADVAPVLARVQVVELASAVVVTAAAALVRWRREPATSAFARAAWLLLVYRACSVALAVAVVAAGLGALGARGLPERWTFVDAMIGAAIVYPMLLVMPMWRSFVLDGATIAFGLVGTAAGSGVGPRLAGAVAAVVGAGVLLLDGLLWFLVGGLGAAMHPPWH